MRNQRRGRRTLPPSQRTVRVAESLKLPKLTEDLAFAILRFVAQDQAGLNVLYSFGVTNEQVANMRRGKPYRFEETPDEPERPAGS